MLAALGCDLPILPGIMPVTNLRQIERFPQLSGSAAARGGARAASRPRPTTPQPCARPGSRSPPSSAAKLLDGGAPGLHFYTLNRSTATLEVFADLGLPASI